MWAIKLANELGRVNVDEMLSEMSPEQFLERVAYWKILEEPEQQVRTDRIDASSPDLLVAMKRKFSGR